MCASVGSFSSSISWPDADRENSMASPGEFKHPNPEGGLVMARMNMFWLESNSTL